MGLSSVRKANGNFAIVQKYRETRNGIFNLIFFGFVESRYCVSSVWHYYCLFAVYVDLTKYCLFFVVSACLNFSVKASYRLYSWFNEFCNTFFRTRWPRYFVDLSGFWDTNRSSSFASLCKKVYFSGSLTRQLAIILYRR